MAPALTPSGLVPVNVQTVPFISFTNSRAFARADSDALMASSRYLSSLTNEWSSKQIYGLFRFIAQPFVRPSFDGTNDEPPSSLRTKFSVVRKRIEKKGLARCGDKRQM